MQILIVTLLTAGLLLTQALMGGFNLLFALPGYSLIAVAAILVLFQSGKKIHPGVSVVSLLSALAVAGYVVWRSLTSPVEYLARMDFFMVLASLAVYLVTACYLKTARQRLWILYALFAFSLLHIAAGILQFTKGEHFMLLSLLPDGFLIPKIFRPDYGWRASGFYGCPNHMAGFLEALGMIALGRCCLGRCRFIVRVVFGYLLLMCFAGIAITGSRGGALSTVTGVVAFSAFVLWIIRKLRRKRFWVSFAVTLVLATLLIGSAAFVVTRSSVIEKRLNDINDMKNVRLLMWKAALQQHQLNPLFGTGSGTYLYYGRQFRAASVQQDPMHVHNDYLELLGEYGTVGASIVGVFLLLHLRSGVKGLSAIVRQRLRPGGRIFSDELALVVGSLCGIITLIVHSILDFNFHIPGNTLFYAFLLGLLASPTSDPKIASENVPLVVRPLRFGLPALGVAILSLGLPLLRGEYHAEWARVQLRNLFFVDMLFESQSEAVWLASGMVTGVPVPSVLVRREWADDMTRSHFVPMALEQATQGLAAEKKNPNLYFYLGEAFRYQAAYFKEERPAEEEARPAGPDSTVRALQIKAGDAYAEGLRLFPDDVRLQFKLAQMLDNLGLLEQAEGVYVKALRADPNLAEVYARYATHLMLRRKLLRAEAYFRRAMALSGMVEVAEAGLQDIARLRARSKDQKYVDQFGDPLEDYDMEPPTDEDEKRGAIMHE